MERGDQVLYPIGSPQSFVNNQDDSNTVILTRRHPAGGQRGTPRIDVGWRHTGTERAGGLELGHPRGRRGHPAANRPAAALRIERMILEPGESIPESTVPTMISLEDGRFDFTTVSGDTQVSRTATPGPQDPAALDEEFSLAPGDAAFFPTGMAEVERPDEDGQISFLRMTIVPIEAIGDGPRRPPARWQARSPRAAELAVIEITERRSRPRLPPKRPKTRPTDEAEAPAGELAVGATVAVTEAEVRLRDAPTVNSNIVTGLDQGAEFTITEGPIEADGLVWWGVQSTADPAIVGYIAGDFIAPV